MRCPLTKTNCCCCHILFTQPDFVTQKFKLKEFITSCSHICNFYPKYHCKLSFIAILGCCEVLLSQHSKTKNIDKMEKNMLACLDDIPSIQIRRYNNSFFYFTKYNQN